MDREKIVNIENLKKSYQDIEALKGVNLGIKEGEIFGLLGPNGAGKSTLINILAGLTLKDTGDITVCGYDIVKDQMITRKLLGIVHQEIISDGFFSIETILHYQSGYFGIKNNTAKINEIIERLGLEEVRHRKVFQLSGGMKRRLLIAKALVHSPKVLVLDEPTAGVDVELRHALWEYVREMNAKGTTVLLTTHYIEEAEELCGRVAIINHGEIVAFGATRDMIANLGNKKLYVHLKEAVGNLPEALNSYIPQKYENGKRWILTLEKNDYHIHELMKLFEVNNIEVTDLWTEEGDLEDVFLNFTGREKNGKS